MVFRITQGQIDVIEKAIEVTGLGLSDVTRVVFNVYRVYFADGTGCVATKPVARVLVRPPLGNRKSETFLRTRDRSIVIWDI